MMSTYRICVINRNFSSSEEIEAANPDAARIQAMKGALQIGVDEICEGKMFFAAQVSIEGGDEPERLVIAIGASPLQ